MWLRRVASRRSTSIGGGGDLARRDRAVDDPADVAAQVGQGERRVEDLCRPRLGGDRAAVADLTAALGVERRAIEEHLDEVVVIGVRDDERATRASATSSV